MVAAVILMMTFYPGVAQSSEEETSTLAKTRYLGFFGAATDFALSPELPEKLHSLMPTFEGALGVRFRGDYEIMLRFSHSIIQSSTTGEFDVAGLNLLGLGINYSPKSFEGWFSQIHLGWLSGAVSPNLSINSGYLAVGQGYNFVLGRIVDFRPLASIQITPTNTSLGNQIWPVITVGVQIVFKNENLTDFLAGFFGGAARSRQY